MENICTHLKMNLDVPKFTRCCICLPLRRSLIAWGYLKLIIVSLLLIYFSNSLWDFLVLFIKWKDTYFIGHILKLLAIVSVLTTEIILNVFLVLGAHKFYKCTFFYL